jgi:hypothetical protein
MNSAAARRRICRQHFADTRTKLSDGIRRLGPFEATRSNKRAGKNHARLESLPANFALSRRKQGFESPRERQ